MTNYYINEASIEVMVAESQVDDDESQWIGMNDAGDNDCIILGGKQIPLLKHTLVVMCNDFRS